MNKEEILKIMGVKILRKYPISSDIKIVGCVNGFFIYPRNYYWVVNGKMPLKYANELYEYRDSLGIRVSGGSNSNNPIDWCTSDEYEDFYDEVRKQFDFMEMNEWRNILSEKKNELKRDKIDDFYIEVYHIDDVKGLKKVVDIIKSNNIKTEW